MISLYTVLVLTSLAPIPGVSWPTPQPFPVDQMDSHLEGSPTSPSKSNRALPLPANQINTAPLSPARVGPSTIVTPPSPAMVGPSTIDTHSSPSRPTRLRQSTPPSSPRVGPYTSVTSPSTVGPSTFVTPASPATVGPSVTITPPSPETVGPLIIVTPPSPLTVGPSSIITPLPPARVEPSTIVTAPSPASVGPSTTIVTPPSPTTVGPSTTIVTPPFTMRTISSSTAPSIQTRQNSQPILPSQNHQEFQSSEEHPAPPPIRIPWYHHNAFFAIEGNGQQGVPPNEFHRMDRLSICVLNYFLASGLSHTASWCQRPRLSTSIHIQCFLNQVAFSLLLLAHAVFPRTHPILAFIMDRLSFLLIVITAYLASMPMFPPYIAIVMFLVVALVYMFARFRR